MNAVTEVMDELRKALAELEDCRARNADLRTMLEQVTRDRDHVEESLVRLEAQRDEARSALAACPDCAMWAERSVRWHDDMQRAERERDEARREAERFRHGCTVEGDFVCPNEYAVSELTAERNFLRALKKNHEEDFTRVCKERDEARAELSKLRKDYDSVLEANVGLLDGAPYVDARAAFRRGAEAMREACARWIERECADERTAWHVARLPIPEDK